MSSPIPSEFEARCNATYEALMWALSRPGMTRMLPEAAPELVVEALLDRECQVHCEDRDLAAFAARTGAHMVTMQEADHVFLSEAPAPEMLKTLRQGSDLHPEDGATLIFPAALGTGQTLRLTGPGIDGEITIKIDGLPEGFWAAREDAMRYPMGFELFILNGAEVLGLPRSTKVELL